MDDNASLDAFLFYRHDRQPEPTPRVKRKVHHTRPAMMLRRLRKIARRAIARVHVRSDGRG